MTLQQFRNKSPIKLEILAKQEATSDKVGLYNHITEAFSEIYQQNTAKKAQKWFPRIQRNNNLKCVRFASLLPRYSMTFEVSIEKIPFSYDKGHALDQRE